MLIGAGAMMIDDMIKNIRAWEQRVIQEADKGAQIGAQDLENEAKDTALYGNVSGATRASTVAFVASERDSGTDKVLAAQSRGESFNPGQTQIEAIPGPGQGKSIIYLTALTRYTKDLVTRRAGSQDFIGDTVYRQAASIVSTVFERVKRALS